ncbi:hypothetical protein Pmani_006687 [Petrolisthes manimaculis]|uniref:Uncharacterized protein n=1 Tax=Petrolisthes manimaculis TaxID=1843537 RepID=A0AAE1Q9U5_9EUCA|nr:hypothetical protein Pmani_006687 [Petrolisthes manimaculis]
MEALRPSVPQVWARQAPYCFCVIDFSTLYDGSQSPTAFNTPPCPRPTTRSQHRDKNIKASFPTAIFPWSLIPNTPGEYSDLGLHVENKILRILDGDASFSVLPSSLSHQHYLFYLFIRLGSATPPGSRPDTIRTKANTGGASAPYPGPGLLQRPADHYNPTPSQAEENQQSPREEEGTAWGS